MSKENIIIISVFAFIAIAFITLRHYAKKHGSED
jgi:positive regulator of sigma E activity